MAQTLTIYRSLPNLLSQCVSFRLLKGWSKRCIAFFAICQCIKTASEAGASLTLRAPEASDLLQPHHRDDFLKACHSMRGGTRELERHRLWKKLQQQGAGEIKGPNWHHLSACTIYSQNANGRYWKNTKANVTTMQATNCRNALITSMKRSMASASVNVSCSF